MPESEVEEEKKTEEEEEEENQEKGREKRIGTIIVDNSCTYEQNISSVEGFLFLS